MAQSRNILENSLNVAVFLVFAILTSFAWAAEPHRRNSQGPGEALDQVMSSKDYTDLARDHIKKIIYSIGCDNHQDVAALHRSALEYLVEKQHLSRSTLKTFMEVYLDDFCYHKTGGTLKEVNFSSLSKAAKLCYISTHRSFASYLSNPYDGSQSSPLSIESLKSEEQNSLIKSRGEALDKIKCDAKPTFENLAELEEFTPTGKTFYHGKLDEKLAANKTQKSEEASIEKPVEEPEQSSTRALAAPEPEPESNPKVPPESTVTPVPSLEGGHGSSTVEAPAAPEEPAPVSQQEAVAAGLADYIKSPNYLFNQKDKIIDKKSTQGEHARQVDEAVHRSVYNLVCEDSPKVLAHSFLKLATLLRRHVSDDKEDEKAISMGDNPYSGVRTFLKHNLESWCYDEQREQRSTERRKKCADAFEQPLTDLFAYGLQEFSEKEQIEDLDRLQTVFEREAVNPKSKLNELIVNVQKGREALTNGDPKIKVVCDNNKATEPLKENEIGKAKADRKYSNSDKVVIGPRPTPDNTITTALPKVNSTEEARRTGYYTYNDGDNYVYGRPHIIWNIKRVALMARQEGLILASGDINDKDTNGDNYAHTPGHSSHTQGRAADFRLMFNDGWGQRGNVGDSGYSADKTARALELFIDQDPTNIEKIYINDENVRKRVNKYARRKHGFKYDVAAYCSGHGNHFHIHWKK